MKIDKTESNPDLVGFEIENMKNLGAHSDGSGGGIIDIAYNMGTLRETQDRIDRLRAFVRKHQMLLARLSWSLEVTSMPPVKREDILFVPQIELCSYTYDKKPAKALDICALWPDAAWSRSKPQYYGEDNSRDYTAEIDGVIVRIKNAERKPEPVQVDRFAPCGPLLVVKG